ncbi:DUF3696 domain-containing protein [Nitrosomonas sp.]|uniref:AAA family ATPase n=1 Tax=Nitrosomonas sp. TaxID=42353 RepID=UPI0026318B08|nr:DUF3696 domain-containing protein [Nitrosomonas sp.]MCW5600160.1 DUF3696 domain-containing protein [Nitrosomonas sp.]
MITKWKVFNFKSIREETELDLGPLTIFAGANSSGKSTFIQSILLVAQTLANKVSSRSVVLNGSLTSLGQFDDLKTSGSTFDQVTTKWTVCPLQSQHGLHSGININQRFPFAPGQSRLKEITCEISFDAGISDSEKEFLQIQPRLFASRMSCTSVDEEGIDQYGELSVRQKSLDEQEPLDIADEIDERIRSGLSLKVDGDEASLSEIYSRYVSAKPIGAVLKHFLPERIIYSVDTVKEAANEIVLALQADYRERKFIARRQRRQIRISPGLLNMLREILANTINFDEFLRGVDRQESLFDEFGVSLTIEEWDERVNTVSRGERLKIEQTLNECEDLYDRVLKVMVSETPETKDTLRIVQAPVPSQFVHAFRYMESFCANSIKYLGPLRDTPKPLYPLAPAADPYDIGLRGEHTAAVLDLHKTRQIRYIPSDNFLASSVKIIPVTRTLETAVTDWLQYLGVAESISSQDKGKLGHELKVGLVNSDATHDLTHVGVGVSQVLPILVMCLLADTDSTLVFEQPELHLHPKVQTLLGDFFLSMALCNKQCIVETHSEYFIDRLRFRIAAATPEKELNSRTKIYFVEKLSQGSAFREVVINEYGAISDWPEGFFDQSQQQAEEILRAAAMKRKASRRNKDA